MLKAKHALYVNMITSSLNKEKPPMLSIRGG